MASVNLQKFYPDNGQVKAAEVNANFNAAAGSSQGINDENVASEGLIRENWVPIDIVHILKQLDIDVFELIKEQ